MTQLTPVAASAQTSPGACRPLPTTGDAGSGVPGAGRPNGSMRSSLPASEVGEAAAARSPPSPVATSRVPSGSTPTAPLLPDAPRGMPPSTVLGTSPGAIRRTALPPGVVA